MNAETDHATGDADSPGELKLSAGDGCTVLKRKIVKLIHSYDNELVIYHTRTLLAEAGFSETDQYILAAAASELATNIIRYAKDGELEVCLVSDQPNSIGIEIFASDNGPGIPNIETAMSEHYSSEKGSLGLGLPSVKRIMDEFYIESIVGKGTRIKAIKWREHE